MYSYWTQPDNCDKKLVFNYVVITLIILLLKKYLICIEVKKV